jgi:predicted lysophospholipase L1 biosynthesis ABC-type transport system permease subunit
MTFPDQGYAPAVIPDDTAGRPLTPGEQAAIAELEQRFLLDAPAPLRDHRRVPRPVRLVRRVTRSTASVPLVALFVTAVVLIVLVIVVGGGALGVAAVLAAVVATALVWPLLPRRFGGPGRPVRSRRRPFRAHGSTRRRP